MNPFMLRINSDFFSEVCSSANVTFWNIQKQQQRNKTKSMIKSSSDSSKRNLIGFPDLSCYGVSEISFAHILERREIRKGKGRLI